MIILLQICEIAHEKDINTQEELTTCLNFLNDLGLIIYYGNANDIFLRNTIILRPQKLIEIFNMILSAKMPNSFMKLTHSTNLNNSKASSVESSLNLSFGYQTKRQTSQQASNLTLQWVGLWEKFDKCGILDDRLLDVLWKNVINQKPGLLGLMKKFDLICERNLASGKPTGENLTREYLVPSRAKINYDEDTDNQIVQSNFNQMISSDYDSDDIEDLSDYDLSMSQKSRLKIDTGKISIVEFYYDFSGFFPGKILRVLS